MSGIATLFLLTAGVATASVFVLVALSTVAVLVVVVLRALARALRSGTVPR